MPHAAALLMLLLTILCDTRQPTKKEKMDYNEDAKFQKQEDKTYEHSIDIIIYKGFKCIPNKI